MENRQVILIHEGWKKKQFKLFGVFCIVFVALGIVVGSMGPHVYEHRVLEYDFYDPETVFLFNLVDFNRLNQFLLIDMFILNNFGGEVTADLVYNVTVQGNNTYNFDYDNWAIISQSTHTPTIKCESKKNCTTHLIVYLPFLHYKHYHGEINLTNPSKKDFFQHVYLNFYFMNKSMTIFQLYFRYSFVILNCIIITYFVRRIHGMAFKELNYEQKWLSICLCGLILFNNPLWGLKILINNWFPTLCEIVFKKIFIIIIFGFWLFGIDARRYNNGFPKERTYCCCKYMKIFILCVTFILLIINNKNDFYYQEYETISDIDENRTPQFLNYIAYCVYIILLIVSTYHLHKETNENGLRHRFLFFFWMMIIVMLFTLIIFFLNIFCKLQNFSAVSLSTYSIYNGYLLFYSFANLPKMKIPGNKISENKVSEEREENIDDSENNENSTLLIIHETTDTRNSTQSNEDKSLHNLNNSYTESSN
ncbi:transmembrane protein [Anaeramoeba flamelloides]|uniref:Transmembrane protein n=1 Tax=Anaeramoeba flamelloides TaxID=1746091 RepID=A0ABQ8YLD0_9EUKA|nr:transmembrane protein [Anaeramoeba flamelloides]